MQKRGKYVGIWMYFYTMFLQNEMTKLGYNKERDEELQGQQKQLTRDVRSFQDRLDTMEAKYVHLSWFVQARENWKSHGIWNENFKAWKGHEIF